MPRTSSRRIRIPSGAEFDLASSHERRQADLFLDDLLGRPPRSIGWTRVPVPVEDVDEPGPRDVGWDLSEDFNAEDLAPDMAGLDFVLATDGDIKVGGAAARQAKGTVVTVVSWDNAKGDIEAKVGGVSATVPKELLEPKSTMYRAKVTTAKRSYEAAIPLYASNLKSRRADLVRARAAGKAVRFFEINRHLILELQLNRQDPLIGRWTFFYDSTIGEPLGWKALAPGWVKSMMVQESTAGTFGPHLSEKADEPWKTRFNVLQAIDSWGFQQYLMMEELEPGLLKKEGLEKVMDDQRKLEKERDALSSKTTRSTTDAMRLAYLKRLSDSVGDNLWWEFFQEYPEVEMKAGRRASSPARSTGSTAGTGTGTGGMTSGASTPKKYFQVVKEFLERGTPKRKYDYSFWIQTGVRWLFEKRKKAAGWSDAVRDFNGKGGGAEFYRAIVLTRARAAAAVAGIDEEIWGGLSCPGKKKTAEVFQLCPFEQNANPCGPRC